ncbi:MAG: phenylalanine--tRNA ligase subunit beta, partial [Burkholderiaceae bacterium]
YGPSADEQWGTPDREVDFFDVKGDLQHLLPAAAQFVAGTHPALHPGRSAVISVADRTVGFIGELHPRLQLAYGIPRPVLVFEVELEALLRRPLPVYREVPRVQAVDRDIALWVADEVPFQALRDVIDSLSRSDDRLSALREVRLFDVYRPNAVHETAANAGSNTLLNKEKSLAFRLVLQDTSSSLSDTDADAAVAAIVEALTQRFGARLRK